jgi:outer membrane protein assembly factor BamE (lipoprotein component of BamABCDE complex)
MSNITDSKTRVMRRSVIWLGLGLTASLVAACQPTIARRGYYAKPGALNQVTEGMAKSEVEAIMGSPSTTASINLQGDSYYYITSVTESRAFLNPTEVSREIIAVRFDASDQVSSVAQYGLEDGKIININSRRTPAAGQEFNILQEMFGNRGNKPGSGPGRSARDQL